MGVQAQDLADRLLDRVLAALAGGRVAGGLSPGDLAPDGGEPAPAGAPPVSAGAPPLPAGAPPPAVAVIGICKNAGKTVALNHLIAAAHRRGLGLALASAGRDGEEKDAITGLPKPRIWAPAGALVATAQGALAAGTAALRVVAHLPWRTPLGPAVVARVTEAGQVLLVGPGSASRLAGALGQMAAAAAAARRPLHLALVDGALDRRAAAAPGVTGAAVLAVGAAYSPSMDATVAQAAHLLELLGLPAAPAPVAAAALAAWARAPLAWLPAPAASAAASAATPPAHPAAAGPCGLPAGPAAPVPLPFPSALAQPAAVADQVAALAAQGPGYLAVAGAVGGGLVAALAQRPELAARCTLLVPDATHLLAGREAWQAYRRAGGGARVVRPVRVAAVVANPWSPVGPAYDPVAFAHALAAAGGLPVLDLVAGLEVEPHAHAHPGARPAPDPAGAAPGLAHHRPGAGLY